MTPETLFDSLSPRPADGLLALIGMFAADERRDKIDLGVGVYKDEAGATPVMDAVKAAEAILLRTQTTKAYLGAAGDIQYVEHLVPVIFGKDRRDDRYLGGIQTPGGTGALKLAAELIALASPSARIIIGAPTWLNHAPIFEGAGLELVYHPYFDQFSQTLLYDQMRAALLGARPGDVVLLHGACHNPTGADLSPAQWEEVTDLITQQRLLPLIDVAYHGLGSGLEADVQSLRHLLAHVPDALVCYSCDKNFGLYRERVGAIFFQSNTQDRLELVRANLLALSRAIWSMPPDHGAAIVRIILESAELTELWHRDLDTMRDRITHLRTALAAGHPRLLPLADQKGMFSLLPLTSQAVEHLRHDHGVYMVASGRANLAGLATSQVPALIGALSLYL